MIQDILTYLTLAGTAAYGLYRLYRTISMIARGETPGCGNCPLHGTMIE
jgi:hypothetical protein